MDDHSQALEIMREHRALLRDTHVVYTSGRHGNAYLNKDAVYPHPRAISLLCRALAEHFAARRPQVVAAPALGGLILSQWTASHLHDLGVPALAVYAEKDGGGGFAFRRGYDRLLAGKTVLVVEDVLTTGGSLKAAIEAVRGVGGLVVGAGALCNRGGVTAAQIGAPPEFHALINLQLDSWEEGECPLCRDGVPINTDVGKGREFLERRAAG